MIKRSADRYLATSWSDPAAGMDTVCAVQKGTQASQDSPAGSKNVLKLKAIIFNVGNLYCKLIQLFNAFSRLEVVSFSISFVILSATLYTVQYSALTYKLMFIICRVKIVLDLGASGSARCLCSLAATGLTYWTVWLRGGDILSWIIVSQCRWANKHVLVHARRSLSLLSYAVSCSCCSSRTSRLNEIPRRFLQNESCCHFNGTATFRLDRTPSLLLVKVFVFWQN